MEEQVYLESLEFSVKELAEAMEKVSFPLSTALLVKVLADGV